MATYYPITKENMLKISGVGLNKFENYGDIFMQAISNYIAENNIQPTNIISVEKSSTSKSKSEHSNTNIISYNLFVEGKTISEIAKIRNLNVRTIETHLLNRFENGLNINLENYIQPNFENDIYAVIDKLGYGKLKPLKEALPPEVTYFDIHYYLVKYKKMHNLRTE